MASDVGAGAGPYARVLAEEIVKPGIEAVIMFRLVQRRVRAAIRQEPYLGFNALGDIYLAGRGERPTATPASEAERAWAAARDARDPVVLEAFIAHFKDGFYADLARSQRLVS